MADYETLDRDTLIRLLQRRDAERQLGLVWERDEIEADAALNDDELAPALDAGLSRELGGRLQSAGSFDLDRMRFV